MSETIEIQQDFTGNTISDSIKSEVPLIKNEVRLRSNGTTWNAGSGQTPDGKILHSTGVADPVLNDSPFWKPKGRVGRPPKEKLKGLTVSEKSFVDAYIDPSNGFNPRTCVVKAGYPEKGAKELGKQLMEDSRILRAIEIGRRQMEMSVATNRTNQLRKLETFLGIAMDKRDVVGASKILDIENRMLGYYEPIKMDITGSINISFGSGEPIIVASKNPDRFSGAEEVDFTCEPEDGIDDKTDSLSDDQSSDQETEEPLDS